MILVNMNNIRDGHNRDIPEIMIVGTCPYHCSQERLCRITQEIKECIKEERCCFPPPTCVDYFYDQFLTNLEGDRKLKKKKMDTKHLRGMMMENRTEEGTF
uniref:Uncharacterized protein n=1 Tax=Cacopsylla melanoneura TaxID=428564 RepID=A0A8D9F3L9_9HEMI